jgi:hypothetical protein
MKRNEEYTAAEMAEKIRIEMTDYVRLKMNLTKADLVGKLAVAIGKLMSHVLLLMVFFFSLLFASFFAGLFLSEAFDSTLKGFGLVAVFYGLLFCLMVLVKRRLIQAPIANSIVSIIYTDQDEKHED